MGELLSLFWSAPENAFQKDAEIAQKNMSTKPSMALIFNQERLEQVAGWIWFLAGREVKFLDDEICIDGAYMNTEDGCAFIINTLESE